MLITKCGYKTFSLLSIIHFSRDVYKEEKRRHVLIAFYPNQAPMRFFTSEVSHRIRMNSFEASFL